MPPPLPNHTIRFLVLLLLLLTPWRDFDCDFDFEVYATAAVVVDRVRRSLAAFLTTVVRCGSANMEYSCLKSLRKAFTSPSTMSLFLVRSIYMGSAVPNIVVVAAAIPLPVVVIGAAATTHALRFANELCKRYVCQCERKHKLEHENTYPSAKGAGVAE